MRNRLLSFLLASYLRLVYRTSHTIYLGRSKTYLDWAERAEREGRSLIILFWHGRLALMPFLSRQDTKTRVMISLHKDGQLIADIIRRFGYLAVRGSSNRKAADTKAAKDRGGARALIEAKRLLKQGENIAITPDGPKGPRYQLQPGAISLAKASGAPVILIANAKKPAKWLNSWDHFMLPLPFGRIVWNMSEPIILEDLDSEAGFKRAQSMVEKRLNELTREADVAIGRSVIDD